MKTSKARKGNSSKKMIILAAAILSTLCIAVNSVPMNAEGGSVSEKAQISEMIVEHKEEVEEEVVAEQYDTELALGYVRVAQAYAGLFRYKDGLPWAEEAIRLDPALPEAHLIYGYLHFKLVHSAEAIVAFERTIELDPSTFEAYDYLGIIYRGRGNLALGIEYFNQAMEVAATPEELSTAYADRGLAYGVMDRFEESIADFETALSINPDNGWAVFYRGNVTTKMSECENATSGQNESAESGAGIGLGS